MSKLRATGSGVLRAAAAMLSACAAVAGMAAGPSAAVAALPKLPGGCQRVPAFDASKFSNPTRIDNTFFPLTPGTRFSLTGQSNVGNVPLPHRVTFTVTDLTKFIDGVRTVVVWDVDLSDGEVAEAELSFFAQDDAGNVWNIGEYPEEYEGGVFLGAPNVWISGLNGSEPGVHMPAQPTVGRSFYLQGYAPDIAFLDCARVNRMGQTATVPLGTFTNVLVTQEKSPLDVPPSGLQEKFHAPGVGIVQVGALNDPQGETLVLSDRRQLDERAMDAAREGALALDAHGYDVSAVYARTPRAEAPAQPPPAPQPASEPAVLPAAAVAGVVTRSQARARLSARSARALVRRVLRARLTRWTITGVSCRLVSSGRAACRFTARRRGAIARGSGIVVLRASRTSPGYRFSAAISRTACHPRASRRCTRKTVWKP